MTKTWASQTGRCLAFAFVALLPAVPAAAEGAKALATYSVDGAPVTEHVILATVLPSGSFSFSSVAEDESSDVTLSWNYIVDSHPLDEDSALLNGQTIIANGDGTEHSVFVTIEFWLCPELREGSVMGGVTSIKATTDSNGGVITCGGGDTLVSVLTDRQIAETLFHCPFSLSKSGAGTLSTTQSFGLPIPSQEGPAFVSTIGVMIDASISDGDKGTFTSLFSVAPAQGNEARGGCPGDVNNDNVVNELDLSALISQWGTLGGCGPADFDADGLVDASDVSVLLNNWGDCR